MDEVSPRIDIHNGRVKQIMGATLARRRVWGEAPMAEPVRIIEHRRVRELPVVDPTQKLIDQVARRIAVYSGRSAVAG